MKRKIFINGKFLTRKATGVDRYAIEVLNAIDQLIDEGHPQVEGKVFIVLKPKSESLSNVTFKNIKIEETPSLRGTLWEQIVLPWVARSGKLVNLCNSAPITTRNHLVVIHDAATTRVPDAFSRGFRLWYSIMIPLLLLLSKKIGTVSKFSQEEISKIYKTNRPIHILREGADHLQKIRPDFSIIEKFHLAERPFLLAVGSASPHKNFRTLVNACELVTKNSFDCVIVGGADPKVFASTDTLPAWVKHVGYVSDAELRALYKKASLFVFPSIYEGYGIPPTEALAEGCPVIASNSASIPEVCGNNAIYFPATDALRLAEILDEVSSSFIDSSSNPRKCIMTATWQDAALDVLSLMQDTQ